MSNPNGNGGITAGDRQAEQLEALALSHAEKALNVLAEIAFDENADPAARVAAASAILDIGWGKPGAAVAVSSAERQAALASGEDDEESTCH